MRGFLFTISFSLLFLLFLHFSVFYANAERERLAGASDAMGVRNDNEIAADIAGDYEKILGADYAVERGAGNKTGFVLNGTLPVAWNLGDSFGEYASFIEGSYAAARNANIGVEVSPDGGARLEPVGLKHYYENGDARRLVIEGNATEYLIGLDINDSCGACANGGSWEWASEGIFVGTEIYANGTRVTIDGGTEGYIDASAANTLSLSFDGGSLSLSIGGSPRKLRVELVGASADYRLAAYGYTGEEARIILPLNVSVGNSTFEGVTLEKK